MNYICEYVYKCIIAICESLCNKGNLIIFLYYNKSLLFSGLYNIFMNKYARIYFIKISMYCLIKRISISCNLPKC